MLTFSTLNAQDSPDSEQIKVLIQFYDDYNNQNYAGMRQHVSGILKMILTTSRMEQIFGANYARLGKARVTNIRKTGEKQIMYDLVYERDTTESISSGFAFTKKNKIIGINSRSQRMHFTKSTESDMETDLSTMQALIDSIVQYKYRAGVFNGCVLAMKDGQVVFEDCAGYSHMESKTELDPNSIFELASCSKQFTAVAILKLAEQNKLNLTDDIKIYFPNLPYKNITIRHLLNHTSGLPSYEELMEKHWDKTKIARNEDIITYLQKHKPKVYFKPGKKYEYSNTGYALLSLIIEKTSGSTFNQYLEDQIFKPLDMNRTSVYNTRRSGRQISENYALGYVYSDSLHKYVIPDSLYEYYYVRYMDGITGDGTVNSTIHDLIQWEKSLRTHQILSPESFALAFSNTTIGKNEKTNYGYGWELVEDSKYQRVVYHSGGWPGYSTFMLHFLDQDISVVVLSNNEYMNVANMVYKVGKILNGK